MGGSDRSLDGLSTTSQSTTLEQHSPSPPSQASLPSGIHQSGLRVLHDRLLASQRQPEESDQDSNPESDTEAPLKCERVDPLSIKLFLAACAPCENPEAWSHPGVSRPAASLQTVSQEQVQTPIDITSDSVATT